MGDVDKLPFQLALNLMKESCGNLSEMEVEAAFKVFLTKTTALRAQ